MTTLKRYNEITSQWEPISVAAKGDPGDNGALWHNGSGAPATGLGAVGDYYLDDDNGDVYEKTGASTWTLATNIKGPAGSSTGDMLAATYDAANIAQQVVGTTATQTLTNKTISGSNNTLSNIAQSSVTNLTTDLAAKVAGPASSTDNAIARFDGTTGKLVQNSGVTVSDTGRIDTTDAIWAGTNFGGPQMYADYIDTYSTGSVEIDGLKTNTIIEKTAAAGVTIDGVLIKDGLVDGKDVSTLTANTGDVVGPASATDNAIVRYDGTTGKLVQNSGVTISDTGSLNVASINNTNSNTLTFESDYGEGDMEFYATSFHFGNGLVDARINPRVNTLGTSGTLTMNIASFETTKTGNLTGAVTFAAPSGTAIDGQKHVLRIKDNGTARALSWNAIFRPIGVTLPTTTVANKLTYVGMIYNSADTKWDVIAVSQEA